MISSGSRKPRGPSGDSLSRSAGFLIVCALGLAAMGCNDLRREPISTAPSEPQRAVPPPQVISEGPRLTTQQPVSEFPVADLGPDSAVESSKFLEVVVGNVANPDRNAVTCEVQRVGSGDGVASETLGVFSLFPSDRPGRFLVATQGKLRPKDQIRIKWINADEATGNKSTTIEIRSLQLRQN